MLLWLNNFELQNLADSLIEFDILSARFYAGPRLVVFIAAARVHQLPRDMGSCLLVNNSHQPIILSEGISSEKAIYWIKLWFSTTQSIELKLTYSNKARYGG